MQWQEWEPSPRDILIDQARRGEITPVEAEREAERLGFGPLATKPDPGEFDPNTMHWWSLPMAVAWIAWRNSASVREHCAEYAQKCLYWIPGSWNVPINNGTEFAPIDGYELRTLGPSTLCRLSLVEAYLASAEDLPTTTQMAVAEAEKQLFAALTAGRLVAIAKDSNGKVVDIPLREWPYLQSFEEAQRDVLKHDALDREAAYSEILLQLHDLKKIWKEREFEFEPVPSNTGTGPQSHINVSIKEGEFAVFSGETTLGSPANHVRRQRAGRKPGYDWDDVELFVHRELDARGDFSDAAQVDDWKCQADLERSVADYLDRTAGKVPATSTIRENIVPMVDFWRSQRSRRK